MKSRIGSVSIAFATLTLSGSLMAQYTPVMSLNKGDAYLYHSEGKSMGGGGAWNITYTTTVIGDTTLDGRLYYKTDDFSLKYSDSTSLIVRNYFGEDTLCNFAWSPGDTVHFDNNKWVVTTKGDSTIFSQSLPYIKVAQDPYNYYVFCKKFGEVHYAHFDAESDVSIVLIGARIKGVVYGSSPAFVSDRENSKIEPPLTLFPNPTSGAINLKITIDHTSDVKVEMFNILGQRIAIPYEGVHQIGENLIRFNAINISGQPLPTGVYLLRFQFDKKSFQRRIMIVR